MLKTNEKKVVEFLLPCQPGPPLLLPGWQVDHEGSPFKLPESGGITLNVQVGDLASGFEGDHVEPGVSCTANALKPLEFPNNILQLYSCVGNTARIVSSLYESIKGAKGVVTGQHGGSEHVMVDFPREVREKMTYEDKIIIQARGQGLKLIDYPDIKLYNLDPDLLKKMKIEEKNGKLSVPVTTIVPPVCMGAGIGMLNPGAGDYDISTNDLYTVKKYKLDQIRLGDFVALTDHDNCYGRTYKKGAITIGIVCHSDCYLAGHGPGVCTLITCDKSLIEPKIDPDANIANRLQIGTCRKD